MLSKRRNNRQLKNPVGKSKPTSFRWTQIKCSVSACNDESTKLFFWYGSYLTSARTQRLGLKTDLALRGRMPSREGGVLAQNPIFFRHRHKDNHTPLGSSQGRQDLSPKISFHYHKKDGEEGVRAAVEKQVISTAAGEQKATWFWARKREEGPEGISERLTLRGWGACLCCSAEIEQTCLLGADADLKILLFRTILSIRDTMTVFRFLSCLLTVCRKS